MPSRSGKECSLACPRMRMCDSCPQATVDGGACSGSACHSVPLSLSFSPQATTPQASRGQRPYRPGASERESAMLALVVPFLHQHCRLNINSSVDWQPGGRLEMFFLSTSVPQNAGIMISVVFRGDNRRPLRILRSPTGCPRFPNLLGQIHGPTTAQHTFRRFLCGV